LKSVRRESLVYVKHASPLDAALISFGGFLLGNGAKQNEGALPAQKS